MQLRLSQDPSALEEIIAELLPQTDSTSPKPLVVIDEIQKIPILLDEVHRLIEEQGYCFLLTGSSGRIGADHCQLLPNIGGHPDRVPSSAMEEADVAQSNCHSKILFFRPRRREYLDRYRCGGALFEQWVAMELRAFLSYRRIKQRLYFWRTEDNVEVDFVVDGRIAVEVEASRKNSKVGSEKSQNPKGRSASG